MAATPGTRVAVLMRHCTSCGTLRLPEARFCTGCGAAHQTPPPGAPQAWPAPRGPAAPGRVIAAVAAVVVAAVGATVVWVVVASARPAPEVVAPPVITAGPATTTPSMTPSTTRTPSPTTALPTTAAPSLVTVGPDGAAHPDAAVVQELLSRHFGSINTKDYDGWASTVTPDRSADQPRDAWLEGYRTTTDSAIVITSISTTGPGAALVGVSFVSTQDIADAPAGLPHDRICWTQQLTVQDLGTDPRLGVPAPGTTEGSPC